jgi:hypothetical protein
MIAKWGLFVGNQWEESGGEEWRLGVNVIQVHYTYVCMYVCVCVCMCVCVYVHVCMDIAQ